MKRKPKRVTIKDTTQDMMKRVFAVAELIVRSDGFRRMRSETTEKHKTEDLLYRVNHNDGLGKNDGTEET